MPFYCAFDLIFESEFSCPELSPSDRLAEPDVRIRLGAVPEALPDAQASGVLFQAAPDRFLLRLDHARYLVRGGTEIQVEILQGGNEDQMRVFLLGSCFGALLHQRGLLVLHASAILTAKGAVVFMGPSGVGKSTILAALMARGYPVVSDDLAVITLDPAGQARLLPAIPRVRLWADSLQRVGRRTEDFSREQPELEKYVLPAEPFAEEAAGLHRVYILGSDNLATGLTLEPLAPFPAFRALVANTYRQRFLHGLGMRPAHFALVSAVAAQAPVLRLTRPSQPFLLEALADRLEADFSA